MYKKGIVLMIVSLFFLGACQSDSRSYQKKLESSLSKPLPAGVNYTKPYYRYYLPSNVGVKSSTEIASLLQLDSYEIMMNLKVSRVIAQNYAASIDLKKERALDNLDYQEEGNYLSSDNQDHVFLLSVYNFADQDKAIILENENVELFSVVDQPNLAYVLEHMMMILRSLEVENSKIVDDFSNKEIVEDKTIHEDFFEHSVPESGSLIDMYNRLHPEDKIKDDRDGLNDDLEGEE